MSTDIHISAQQIDILANIANTGLNQLTDENIEMIQAFFSRIVLATVESIQAKENQICATIRVSAKTLK